LRISTSHLLNNMMEGVTKQLSHLNKLSQDAATGKRIRRPSNDPVAASRSLALRALKSGLNQHKNNVADSRDWLLATETALMNLNGLFEQANDLVLDAANQTRSDKDKEAFVQELDRIIEEAVAVLNTRHDDRFIFGGLATTVKPFSFESGEADEFGEIIYHGADDSTGRKEIEVEPGMIMQVNINGKSAFMTSIEGAGGRSITEALIDIRNHVAQPYSSPTFHDDLADDIDSIVAIQDHILNHITGVGAKVRNLARVSDKLSQNEVELASLLSKAEDADIAETIVELQLQHTVYMAILYSTSDIMKTSLLDYLR
jgi:flagellar hook-associated protein 3 FlgL